VWTITSGLYALSGHVQVDDQRVSESAEIMEGIRGYLARQYHIEHTTIQFECDVCATDLACAFKTVLPAKRRQ
jgi:cobalt-zinc-cadmium efflux system protein